MWMACKMEEITAPSVDDFVYISADSYSKHEITEMESAVCDALQFQLMQVTPYDASIELWRASRADRMPTEFSCIVEVQHPERSLLDYLLELSALSYALASVSPRKVASAAVYLSRIVLGLPGWSPTLEYVSGWKSWDLEEVVLTLYQYYASAEESKLTNAYLKYSKTKYHCVALKTVPLEQDLGF
jgi:Cyclin, C-terminal domain/Cyclin, N-terminal domain